MKLLPLAANSKSPLKGQDWHDRISDDPANHADWMSRGWNVGFPVEENGCVVVDFDQKEAARRFWKDYVGRGIFNVVTETRRGAHFYYAGSTPTRKFEYGDIKGNGYVVYPPSKVEGWTYRFVTKWEEPLPFPERLFPIEDQREITRAKVKDVATYLSHIESVQGQHGSRGLVRAAAVCRDCGLTEAEAMARMVVWNLGATVKPAWTLDQLARAVHRVFLKGACDGHDPRKI